jgi:hypothetical protein
MKMFSKVVTGVVGMTAALALTSTTAQANLLIDPGFESGAPGQPNPIPLPGGAGGGWAVFNGAAYANAAAETGQWGLSSSQAPGQAWNFAASYQIISGVIAGQQYTLTADFMTPTGITEAPGGYIPAVIQLTYFNAAGTDLGTVETGGAGALAAQYMPTGTWQTGTVTATAPVGAVYVAPYLAFMENGTQTGTDTLYYDNGTLTLVPEPATVALLGIGLSIPLYLIRRRK